MELRICVTRGLPQGFELCIGILKIFINLSAMAEIVSDGAEDLLQGQHWKTFARNRLRGQAVEKREDDGVERHTSARNPISFIAHFDVFFFHSTPMVCCDGQVLSSCR